MRYFKKNFVFKCFHLQCAFACAWSKIANFWRFMKRKQLHTNSMLQCLIYEIYILIESPFYTENFGANFSHVDLSMRELQSYN